jgi:tetratricopeptide (TPR) repeat protein
LTVDSKSQIAIQYCYAYKSEQPDSHVFWVHCGSVARFDQAYKEIARKLKLPGLHDPATNLVKSVHDWLSDDDNSSWLLVLDNADDQEMFFGSSDCSTSQDVLQRQLGPLAQYLPRSTHGSTLITTRNRRVGERFAERDKPIVVLPLETEDAKVMLRLRLPDHLAWTTAAEVLELLESLQTLPLAISQAASYISEEELTVARYLELLRPGDADSKALLEQDYYDSRRHVDIHNSVFQTWKLSFIQIRQQVPRAAEILSLMCVLDKQSISRKLLENEGESQVVLDRAFATLKNFSLIQEGKSKQTYQIHRLVQLSTQWWLEQEKSLVNWQEKALEVLLREHPSSGNVEDWKAWESISPHVTIVQGHHFERAEQRLQYAEIISKTAEYNRKLGRYEVAVEMEEEALTIRQELLGQNHPHTLISMNNLGLVLEYQGKYEQAEEMHRQSLRLREAVLGEEHPDTLMSMNNVATVLEGQGKYEQAEEMHRQSLRLKEAVLGKEHPDTLTGMNNLATALAGQGKYEQAEEMLRQSLRLEEAVLGKEHPDTLMSMNNLALALAGQGKYEQAEEMHRQSLRLEEAVLGKEHPDTLTNMNNLALALAGQSKYEQAEEMYRQTLRLEEAVLGKEHPHTLLTICNLAYLLSTQKRFGEADALYQRALNGYEKTLAPDHPTFQACRDHYSLMLKVEEGMAGKDNVSQEAALRRCRSM